MKNPAVQAIDLCRQFGHFMAVDHIHFSVNRGEIFGFLGANGAGKTTTIRMLTGLLMPTSGEGWVNGYSIRTDSEKIKRTIGYMSQKFSLYNDLTVKENLEFYGGIYGLKSDTLTSRIEWILNKLQLREQRNTMVHDIPLGWKQKLALGAAIVHSPPILFLDEPTSGVDPISRREFWLLINELAQQGTTAFVTTHYMDEAEYCNRLSIMHDGKIIAMETPNNLKKQFGKQSIEEVFISLIQANNSH